MPNVGGKKFSYGPGGQKAAKRFAKKTGLPVQKDQYSGTAQPQNKNTMSSQFAPRISPPRPGFNPSSAYKSQNSQMQPMNNNRVGRPMRPNAAPGGLRGQGSMIKPLTHSFPWNKKKKKSGSY